MRNKIIAMAAILAAVLSLGTEPSLAQQQQLGSASLSAGQYTGHVWQWGGRLIISSVRHDGAVAGIWQAEVRAGSGIWTNPNPFTTVDNGGVQEAILPGTQNRIANIHSCGRDVCFRFYAKYFDAWTEVQFARQ